MPLGRFWTPSNALSLLRLILALPIGIALWHRAPVIGTVTLMLAAAVTDAFDGHLARRRGETTEWGKILDPLADKVCIGVAAVILTWQGHLPIWFATVILGRDVLIVLGALGLRGRLGRIPSSELPGKIAAAAAAGVLILATLETEPSWAHLHLSKTLLPFVALLLGAAFLDYLRRAWTLLKHGITAG
ncbi:MAG: CDP-alcohol phosphatidyltransferase family protein [Bacteroidetes bacterium]|nr:CDP-alcohol phosphatidyltransferase family protein [Rhodothermia bacterium]MCS7155378.1 CDP-alcohol phosphatidyltransferase family protein [Bacteroidota bacterium]MCX7907529.1 CDP-alcohol phosphatidyltransferase family protein [Bacteroidota bacterium]MDW8138523.1 CDP-alcohol phosphatidyltransferase family protein [Bacteroidota bacterium]MDW8284540.1 CDP-alcohol phosphatidyltransferase family protein [Bacteroidota bacterium]